MQHHHHIGVIGSGSWGTALAQSLAAGGRDVTLLTREAGIVDSINAAHENKVFLPGIPLHAGIRATTDQYALAGCAMILIVTPAQYVRTTLKNTRPLFKNGIPAVICAKGIEIETGHLLSQVAAEEVPEAPAAFLTGPTFAGEIARGLPSAVTIACADPAAAQAVCDGISSRTLRAYISDDPIGAQIGGAVKNVIAIACGIVTGRKLGDSGRAALLTRGLAEIARLTAVCGGKRETLLGMCGIGDLTLTCSSPQSRNFSLGLMLGEGRTLEDILKERRSVTEGVHTAKALIALAARHGIEMPICEAVHHCLHGDWSIDDAIKNLMSRPVTQQEAK